MFKIFRKSKKTDHVLIVPAKTIALIMDLETYTALQLGLTDADTTTGSNYYKTVFENTAIIKNF